jgi:hypothetical protein
MLGIESRYWRAVGTMESLMIKARSLGQHWLKGVGEAASYIWGRPVKIVDHRWT